MTEVSIKSRIEGLRVLLDVLYKKVEKPIRGGAKAENLLWSRIASVSEQINNLSIQLNKLEKQQNNGQRKEIYQRIQRF